MYLKIAIDHVASPSELLGIMYDVSGCLARPMSSEDSRGRAGKGPAGACIDKFDTRRVQRAPNIQCPTKFASEMKMETAVEELILRHVCHLRRGYRTC